MAESGTVPTWTRTVAFEDAAVLLDAAQPGMTLDDWAELGHQVLPQAQRASRTHLIRVVRDDLLDHDETRILDRAFLRLFQEGSPRQRAALVTARTAWRRPVVLRSLEKLVHPALARADEPLASHDADLIPDDAWRELLVSSLPANTGATAVQKTRSTVISVLADAGVVELDPERVTRVRHARPDPLAYTWMLAHELRVANRAEAPESWALRDAFAARLFAPEPHYAATCLNAGIEAGLLVRGYLAGAARLHPAENV